MNNPFPLSFEKMGEQLICKLNPTSDLVKKQLSQLRDQWQTLKQTAANQTRALGGAKNLQEFNKKVDKLEAWIKEKVKLQEKYIFPSLYITKSHQHQLFYRGMLVHFRGSFY